MSGNDNTTENNQSEKEQDVNNSLIATTTHPPIFTEDNESVSESLADAAPQVVAVISNIENEEKKDLVADIAAHSKYLDEHPIPNSAETVYATNTRANASTNTHTIIKNSPSSSNLSSHILNNNAVYTSNDTSNSSSGSSESSVVIEISAVGHSHLLDIHDTIQDTDDQFEHVVDEDEEQFQLIPHLNDEHSKWMIWIPIVFWLPRYNWKEWLPADLISGMTNVVMLIPQGMGYALVAGLPVQHGLYASLVGPLLYFPFGTSGQMSVAAMAVAALMVYETVSAYVDNSIPENEQKYAAYCACLAFQVGCIQLLLGIIRAGVLANMLAKPVMVGFTAAVTLLISMSQMKFMFNIEINGADFLSQFADLCKKLPTAHAGSILTTIMFSIFLFMLQQWKKNAHWFGSKYIQFMPGALIAVLVGTFVSYGIGSDTGYDIIGSLDNGLPGFSNFLPYVEDTHFWNMWVNSALIALIIFIENYSVTTKFGDKHNYSSNPSQELVALGICNLVGSWFQILPIGGAISRCAVIDAAGAKTPLNSCFAGVLMLFCSLFLLSLFKWLPKPVLASIVLVGVVGLFDYKMMILLWKLKKKDFYVMVCTILITLLLGIDLGVAVGVIASVVVFIQHAAKPHYGVLGKLPGVVVGEHTTHSIYRNIKHHPEAILRRDMLFIRWDASLFFANINSFKKRVRKHIGRFLIKNEFPKPWCLALCFSGVNDIDSSACVEIRAFFIELREKQKDMTLLIAKLKTEVLMLFAKADVVSVVGKDNFLLEVHQAELWWEDYLNNRHLVRNSSAGSSEKKEDVKVVYSRFSGATIMFPTELHHVKTNEDFDVEDHDDDGDVHNADDDNHDIWRDGSNEK